MAGFDYLGSAKVADRLIRKFGMAAVLRRASDTPTDRPCWVVITDYLPTDKASQLANPTDRRVLLSALDDNGNYLSKPPNNEMDQLVTFVQPPANSPAVNEVLPFTCPVKPVAPGGITILYEFTVRR